MVLRILIVDDNHDKIRRITKALQEVEGVTIDSIEHLSDARSAKQRLEATRFDLLILDIAIPARVDEDVRKNGGIELLNELLERDVYKMPMHIVAITALPDVYSKESAAVEQRLVPLLYCDQTSDEWLSQLQSQARRAIAAKLHESVDHYDFRSFLAVVCALEIPELNAVRRNGWDWQYYSIPNDATTYYKTTLDKNGEHRICYAAAAPRKGMPAAAVLATKMIYTFKPMYLAMTGITAGYVGKTKAGDVIAADPVWDWGSGKLVDRNGDTLFEPESHQLDLEVGIRNKLKLMAQDSAALHSIREAWAGEAPLTS